MASPQFAAAWNRALTRAHEQLVAVLSGDTQSIVVQGGTVCLDLAPFVDAAKQRLAAEGLTAVNVIPEAHPTIALVAADQLVRAQSAYALDSLATVLPWITLLVLAVGIYLARVRMRALVAAGLGVALALVLLAAGLLVARGLLVAAVPPAGAPAAAASFDIIVGSLRTSGRVVLVLALVVALGAFLAGSSPTAVGVRRWRRTFWAASAEDGRRPDQWAPGYTPTCGDCGSGRSRWPHCCSCSFRSRRARRSLSSRRDCSSCSRGSSSSLARGRPRSSLRRRSSRRLRAVMRRRPSIRWLQAHRPKAVTHRLRNLRRSSRAR